MSRITWIDYFADIARLTARRSQDSHTQVGAVVFNPKWHTIVSVGYNGFPRGIDKIPTRWYDRPEKYARTSHAEANAIYNAGLHGASLFGCHLVTTHFPCSNCGIAIIQSGIEKVYHLEHIMEIPEHRHNECMVTIDLFVRASVPFECIGE